MTSPLQASQLKASRATHQTGFTLVELLITVAIVAILAAIAYPTYTNQVAKARRAEMQAQLMSLAGFMERIYTESGCYNPDYRPAAVSVCGVTGVEPDINTGDGNEYYTIAFSEKSPVTANTFLIEATPISTSAQAGDGVLQINHLGERYWNGELQ